MALLRKKNQPLRILLIITGLIILFTTVYNVWDNQRIVIVQQEIQIKNLPSEFVGYKILLLSDLHGKRFGESQKYITRLINELNYDVIIIAGDMQDNQTHDIEPLLELLRGLEHRTPIYYTAGNIGPYDTKSDNGDILAAGQVLQAEGVSLLTLPIQIKRGGQQIWFVPYFSYLKNKFQLELAQIRILMPDNGRDSAYYARMINHQTNLRQAFTAIQPEEVLICVTHYPLARQMLQEPVDIPPYDLILAGHYHGGQMRLPWIGALYIPDGLPGLSGFLPKQAYVSGLYQGKEMQQYISRGLGAGGSFPFLKFRLFNTPEIDLLTLVK